MKHIPLKKTARTYVLPDDEHMMFETYGTDQLRIIMFIY